ncbi:MAG: hypothetical protein ACE5I1_23290 [bacterium]
MAETKKITQIAMQGGSGNIPTDAMQFKDDWPGLFVRGDDALAMFIELKSLQDRLKKECGEKYASLGFTTKNIMEIIEKDVIVRNDD